MEWSFRVFRIFGEHVIMEKRDAQKNIFLSWLLLIVMFGLDMWEVFLWLGLSLCVKGLR